jgi:5,5'-dehydrodivanillate O-demethylase
VKLALELTEYGIVRRRLLEGQDESNDGWTIGQLMIFPNISHTSGNGSYISAFRVPVDDEHTLDIQYWCYDPGPGIDLPKQDVVPVFDASPTDLNIIFGQDCLIQSSQGVIVDRTHEKLVEADKGIILYRKLLVQEMKKVAAGLDPMNVWRNGEAPERIILPHQTSFYDRGPTEDGQYRRGAATVGYLPDSRMASWIEDIFVAAANARAAARTADRGNLEQAQADVSAGASNAVDLDEKLSKTGGR